MAAPLIVAASLAVLTAAPPESPTVVAKKMAADYRRAILAKDSGYFMKNSTEDFTYSLSNGPKAGKRQALAGVKQSFDSTKKVDLLEMKVVSARRAEGGVLFTADCKMKADMDMGGKTGRMESKFRTEMLVVPLGKGWAYKRVKMLTDDTKVDGKPMKM